MTTQEKQPKPKGAEGLLAQLRQTKEHGFPFKESLSFFADLAALFPTLKPEERKKIVQAIKENLPDSHKI